MMSIKSKYKKLFNWEHWSVYLFYLPILPYAFYEALKSRHLCFFYSTNPGIYHSGNGTESKYKTLQVIPDTYRPETIFIHKTTKLNSVLQQIEQADIKYPFIAKPDIGFRGYLVKLINNVEELKAYISKFNEIDIIFQEYISFNKECGIFYTRKPSEKIGTVTSVTLKKFLTVTGNGEHTLKELIIKDERAKLYYDQFKALHLHKFEEIIEKNLSFQLTVIGNHSKGTQFINGNHLISDDLIKAVDKICHDIEGFNYGRLDIKYDDLSEIKKGGKFKILEVNGIISEPTHVFDTTTAKSGYWNTLKEQIKHWALLSEIAREHHRINRIAYHPFSAFIKDLFWLKKHTKRLKILNKL